MSGSQARVIRELRDDLAILALADALTFPVPGAPTIVVTLAPNPGGDRWSIVRTGWNEPVVLLPGAGWVPLESIAIADRYCWTDSAALQQVPALLAGEEQAVAAWRAKHDAEAERARAMAEIAEEFLEAAAAVVPAETVPVVTLQEAHQPDPGITIPAPADRPDYQPEPPDPAEADTILTPKAAAISANAEQPTVALPQARIHGPEETQELDVGPIPPKPTRPPDVPPHLEPFPPVEWGVDKPAAEPALTH